MHVFQRRARRGSLLDTNSPCMLLGDTASYVFVVFLIDLMDSSFWDNDDPVVSGCGLNSEVAPFRTGSGEQSSPNQTDPPPLRQQMKCINMLRRSVTELLEILQNFCSNSAAACTWSVSGI